MGGRGRGWDGLVAQALHSAGQAERKRCVMQCHKCGWAAKIKQWEHEGVKFEDTPCAVCSLEEDSRYTKPVEEERMETSSEVLEFESAGVECDGAEMLPVSVMADAVRLLLSLPKDALEVIRLRYGGMPYAEIGRLIGLGQDAAEKRFHRALDKHPVLESLFPRKVRRQRQGRRCGKRKGR